MRKYKIWGALVSYLTWGGASLGLFYLPAGVGSSRRDLDWSKRKRKDLVQAEYLHLYFSFCSVMHYTSDKEKAINPVFLSGNGSVNNIT